LSDCIIATLYWPDNFRTIANEDDSVTELWKKMTVLDVIWHISGMVFCEYSNAGLVTEETSSRSRGR
jgi:hypothetical protein